jgi:titin
VNYNVRIIAVNAAGSSAPSLPVAKPVTFVYLPPLAPTLTAAVPGNGSALITFTAPALRGAPITGYAYSIDASGLVLQDISGALTSPITISGLTNDTLYNIRIAAITPAGYSPLSIARPVTPVFKEPGVPVVGTVVAGNGQLTVNFTAPVANGSPIIEYKYTLNGGVKIPAVLAVGGKSFVITKNVVDEVDVPLVNGTAYQVQMCATNSIGDSILSVAKPGTPKA